MGKWNDYRTAPAVRNLKDFHKAATSALSLRRIQALTTRVNLSAKSFQTWSKGAVSY